jgi:hypothetical protein
MAQSPNNFSLGFADSVRSDILKEQRHLLIHALSRQKIPCCN